MDPPKPSRPSRSGAAFLVVVLLVVAITLRPPPLRADDRTELALGPVVYRCLGLEALRLRTDEPAEGRDLVPRVGAAGRWHAVPWPTAEGGARRSGGGGRNRSDVARAEHALLAELTEADGGPVALDRPATTTRGDTLAFHWFLVATWEASALAVVGRAGPTTHEGQRLVVAARRAVAHPLPPPDLRPGETSPGTPPIALRAPWRPADLRAPPPHPDPEEAHGSTQQRPRADRGAARRTAPAAPIGAGTDVVRAVAAARRGNVPVAARAFEAGLEDATQGPDDLLLVAWRAEVDAALGRFPVAASRYATAALAIRPRDEPDVAAWVASRAAVLRHRAGVGRTQGSSPPVPWPHGDLDARGDVVHPRAPPRDPTEALDDLLPTARRATAAWWAAARARAAGR